MTNSIKDKLLWLKEKYPLVFWVTCILLAPLSLSLFAYLLFFQKKDTLLDANLEDALKAEGRGDAHEQYAEEHEKKSLEVEKTIQKKEEELRRVEAPLRPHYEKYLEEKGRLKELKTWEEVDKKAGL